MDSLDKLEILQERLISGALIYFSFEVHTDESIWLE